MSLGTAFYGKQVLIEFEAPHGCRRVREEVDVLMKKTTGIAAGYVPRPVAPTFGIVEGTRAPAPRPRTGASSSPLHEPDSSPEVLTV